MNSSGDELNDMSENLLFSNCGDFTSKTVLSFANENQVETNSKLIVYERESVMHKSKITRKVVGVQDEHSEKVDTSTSESSRNRKHCRSMFEKLFSNCKVCDGKFTIDRLFLFNILNLVYILFFIVFSMNAHSHVH